MQKCVLCSWVERGHCRGKVLNGISSFLDSTGWRRCIVIWETQYARSPALLIGPVYKIIIIWVLLFITFILSPINLHGYAWHMWYILYYKNILIFLSVTWRIFMLTVNTWQLIIILDPMLIRQMVRVYHSSANSCKCDIQQNLCDSQYW